MHIPAHERGHIRVFALDLDSAAAQDFSQSAQALATALSIDQIDPAKVEIFDIADLEQMPLSTYLIDAQGAERTQIAPDAARLDQLRGHVVLVFSSAVTGQTLTPTGPLRWIGTYSEPDMMPSMEPLTSDGAQGQINKKPPPSNAAIGGRVATVALAFMFLLVILMIVIAG